MSRRWELLRRPDVWLVVPGLALTLESLAPWYGAAGDEQRTAWTSPHRPWLGVLLCLGAVAGRLLYAREPDPHQSDPGRAGRWAAILAAAGLVVAGWGWLREIAAGDAAGPSGTGQSAWVLQDQGTAALGRGPLTVAWGYPVGLGLIAVLAVVLFVSAGSRFVSAGSRPEPPTARF